MRDDVRSYCDIQGLSKKGYEAIKDYIPFDQVEYNEPILKCDYEGIFIDIEDFLDRIIHLIDDNGWGKLDFIDHLEFTITRYDIKKGSYESREMKRDNILDPMMS
ncbi:MAG: hypothetical protein ACNI27_12375 [Desulfovibrio sp.]